MKIVFCKGQLFGPISGADETLVTYTTQLQKAGHRVSVLLMYLGSLNDPYYLRMRDAGVSVSWIASDLAHTSLDAGRKLALKLAGAIPVTKQLIRRHSLKIATGMASRYYESCLDHLRQSRADLIHVMTPDPSAMVMIRAGYEARIPIIYQELGMPYHPPDYKSYYKQFTSVLPFCSEITALSPQLLEQCRVQLPQANSISILPIMSDSPYHERPPSINHRPVICGFAARIENLKGPIVLVEAFGAACRAGIADMELRVAGDGSFKREMAARAVSLGIADLFHHTGIYTTPEERNAFMRSIDIFVLPSFSEGTPNCIVEAMAHGKPIIASAVGGIPDMITEECGILVPTGDSGKLTAALLRLAQDSALRTRMGTAARARYQKLFSPAAVLPIVEETYLRVAKRNGKPQTMQQATGASQHPWLSHASPNDS